MSLLDSLEGDFSLKIIFHFINYGWLFKSKWVRDRIQQEIWRRCGGRESSEKFAGLKDDDLKVLREEGIQVQSSQESKTEHEKFWSENKRSLWAVPRIGKALIVRFNTNQQNMEAHQVTSNQVLDLLLSMKVQAWEGGFYQEEPLPDCCNKESRCPIEFNKTILAAIAWSIQG